MKSRLDHGFVAQPRNHPPTSSCCSYHHAARTRPRWPPGPSNEAYLSSPHLEASPVTTFRACSSPGPTPVKPQPSPAILSHESVHTTLSITHHTRKRPSTGPRTTHGPQIRESWGSSSSSPSPRCESSSCAWPAVLMRLKIFHVVDVSWILELWSPSRFPVAVSRFISFGHSVAMIIIGQNVFF
jgi:hypothetical protein